MITGDHTLFEDDKEAFIIHESYMQLKGPNGEIDFIVHQSEKLPYSGDPSPIKALSPLPWRAK